MLDNPEAGAGREKRLLFGSILHTVMTFLLSQRLCLSSDFRLPSVTGSSAEKEILKDEEGACTEASYSQVTNGTGCM